MAVGARLRPARPSRAVAAGGRPDAAAAETPPAGTRQRVVVAAAVALAALSLLLPSIPEYDPWAWILWGREVVDLDLATADGPSWKPLPVLFTAPFSLLGDAAPYLWLVVARAGGLLALAFAYRLASRLAGRGAGLVAMGAIVLLPGWVRYMAHGYAEPLVIGLLLWAVERHLDSRRGHAFLLGFLAALGRPEVWPFIGLYGLFLIWREPRMRLVVPALGALVLLLWFGAEYWGSGDPFGASERALVSDNARRVQAADRPWLEVLRNTYELVIVPVQLLALAAVAFALRRRERLTLALAAGALGWLALVIVQAQRGYPAIQLRYTLPAVALVSLLAGVGAARIVAAAGGGPARRALAAGLLLALASPFVVARAPILEEQASAAEGQVKIQREFRRAVERAGGPAPVRACGYPTANHPLQTALAWELDVPTPRVRRYRSPGIIFLRPNFPYDGQPPRISPADPDLRAITRVGRWYVFAVSDRGGASQRPRIPPPPEPPGVRSACAP